MKLEKVGRGKYQVVEIYKTPEEPFDRRSLGNARGVHHVSKSIRQNKCFDVDEQYALKPGVYKIENEDYVYIGSTTRKLTTRFSEHYNNMGGVHTKTYNILINDGKFTCLESFDEDTDEDVIRNCEMEYIRKYQNTDKILVNSQLRTYGGPKPLKCKTIKVPIKYLDEVTQCLNDNGFFILEGRVYQQRDEV